MSRRMRTRLFRWLAASAMLFAGLGAASANAATLTVDAHSRGGACSDSRTAGEAQDPSTPGCSLPRAPSAAPDGGTIQVRAGTYSPASVSDRHLTVGITVAAAPGETPVV